MKYALHAALLALLAALLAALPAAAQQDAAQERLEDLQALCSALEEGHAHLYAHISREDFEGKRADIARSAGELSDSAFYYALRALVASVGDAHTSIDYSDSRYAHLRALPFAIAPMEGRWILAMADESVAGYLGWTVTAIDGTPMEEVFERAKTIISHENDVWAAQQLSNTINFLDALQYLGIAPADAQGVTLSLSRDGRSAELDLPAMDEEEILQASIARLTPQAWPQTAPSGYYRALALSDQVFFIQYNVCAQAPDLSMIDFTEAALTLLREGAYSRLILDLRYNSGGDSSVWWPLRDALAMLRKERPLTVFVLIGPDTFSSGIIDALEAREMLGATLVGSPTGGSVNGFGELQSVSLPHAPMTAYYSTRYFELEPGYPAGCPLLPDAAVEGTLQDYLEGRDAVVEAAMTLPPR